MTDDTHLSVRGSIRCARLSLALVALIVFVTTVPTLAVGQSDPAISIKTEPTVAGETATTSVVLTSVPNGLAGYQIDLAIDDRGVARFENASYSDRFGLTTDPIISSNGSTITIEAADLNGQIEPGASDVTLATVQLTGVEGGETQVTVASSQVDADGGGVVEPATEPATLEVSAGAPTEAVAGAAEAPATAGDSSSMETTGMTDTTTGGNQSTTGVDGALPILIALVALAAVAALAARTA
jgi:hypothetical protein